MLLITGSSQGLGTRVRVLEITNVTEFHKPQSTPESARRLMKILRSPLYIARWLKWDFWMAEPSVWAH